MTEDHGKITIAEACNSPVSNLLSIRTRNGMCRFGYEHKGLTLGGLAEAPRAKIVCIKNVGRKSRIELANWLVSLGLSPTWAKPDELADIPRKRCPRWCGLGSGGQGRPIMRLPWPLSWPTVSSMPPDFPCFRLPDPV